MGAVWDALSTGRGPGGLPLLPLVGAAALTLLVGLSSILIGMSQPKKVPPPKYPTAYQQYQTQQSKTSQYQQYQQKPSGPQQSKLQPFPTGTQQTSKAQQQLYPPVAQQTKPSQYQT